VKPLKWHLLIPVAVFIGVGVLFIPRVLSFLSWSRDYQQAEPLFEMVIWPLAEEMKRFAKEHGRSPASLEEMIRYAPGEKFSELSAYRHEFTPTGPQRFYLHVNSRFQFVIHDHFTPTWIWPQNRSNKSTGSQ
jgi:hypothetical protein